MLFKTRKNSLIFKNTILLFSGLVIISGIMVFFLYSKFEKQLQDRTDALIINQMEIHQNRLSQRISEVEHDLEDFIGEVYVQRILIQDYSNHGDISQIKETITNLCVGTDCINVYLYANGLNTIYSAYGYDVYSSIYRLIQESRISIYKSQYEQKLTAYSEEDGAFIVLSKMIRDEKASIPRGVIIAKLPLSILIETFDNTANNEEIYVLTEDGTVIYQPYEKNYSLSLSDITLYEEGVFRQGNTNIGIKKVENSNMYLIVASGNSAVSINQLLDEDIFRIVMLFFAIVLIAFVVIAYYQRQLLLPLRKLTDAIHNSSADNLVEINVVDTGDEIEALEDSYNGLVFKINDMITSKYMSELALREAQIKTLQYQINPHFVNNSLQLIASMAAEKNMYEMYDMITAFSRIFFYNLKFKGESSVMFREELEFLEYYFMMQKARFPDIFTYELKIDDAAHGFTVPKMIIQPIVENCFSHAFPTKEDNWHIVLTARIMDGVLEISVKDNGKGIPQDQVKVLMEDLKRFDLIKQWDTEHIGIRNANARLCLLYGPKYCLRFTTKEEEGTTFFIRIPSLDGGATND